MGQVAFCLFQGEWKKPKLVQSCELSNAIFAAVEKEMYVYVILACCVLWLSLAIPKSCDMIAVWMRWNSTFLRGRIICLWIIWLPWGCQPRWEKEGWGSRRWGKLPILSGLSGRLMEGAMIERSAGKITYRENTPRVLQGWRDFWRALWFKEKCVTK